MTAPWKRNDTWMDEEVCDFCMSENYWSIIELVLTGDQPPVYVCSSCLIEATLEYNNKLEDTYDQANTESKDVTENIIEEIYARGLDLKVHGEAKHSELDIGNFSE
jgi:hypothetical protein